MKLSSVVGGMSTNQKITVVVIALLVPFGSWLTLGAVTTQIALAALGASEVAAVIASLKVIMDV